MIFGHVHELYGIAHARRQGREHAAAASKPPLAVLGKKPEKISTEIARSCYIIARRGTEIVAAKASGATEFFLAARRELSFWEGTL